jgi:hypothetical protein
MGGNEKTMSHKTTLLINSDTGELECKICGSVFYSPVKPINGEIYYRTEFSCPNGCTTSPDRDLTHECR